MKFVKVSILVVLLSFSAQADITKFEGQSTLGGSCWFEVETLEGKVTSLKGFGRGERSAINVLGTCRGFFCEAEDNYSLTLIGGSNLSDPSVLSRFNPTLTGDLQGDFKIAGKSSGGDKTTKIELKKEDDTMTYRETIKTGINWDWITVGKTKIVCKNIRRVD